MTCPRCSAEFEISNEEDPPQYIWAEDLDTYEVQGSRCPKCDQFIVYAHVPDWRMIYPYFDLTAHVPEDLHKGFREACRILKESPNASAGASRRCLQKLIRRHFGISKANLHQEIEALVARRELPSVLAEDLSIVRVLGNIGVHAEGGGESGEEVEVDPAEAQWLIDILERLLDYLFVAPERMKQQTERRRNALNEKLGKVGRTVDWGKVRTEAEPGGQTVH